MSNILDSTADIPRTYLDHNIYDKLVKENGNTFKDYLKSNFQIVYSDENIKEIERSTGYQDRFIEVLEYLNAQYMELVLNDYFRITDKVKFIHASPKEVFAFKRENRDPIFERVTESMQQMAFKWAGGLKGNSFETVINQGRGPFFEMLQLIDGIENTEEGRQLPIDFALLTKEMKDHYEYVNESLKNTLNEHIKNQEDFRGPKDFRDQVKIGPDKLNNIKPPNVVLKVWESLSEVPEFSSSNITLERFFGLDLNAIYPGEEQTVYGKVIAMYSILNTIGYYPDTNTDRQRRFISSLSDQNHAANGIFAKLILTMDERFSKKAEAIYEYLNIGTQVYFLGKDGDKE